MTWIRRYRICRVPARRRQRSPPQFACARRTDARWHKLAIFALSGAIAGLAGALFASWGGFINPEVFSLAQSAQVVIWVLVGGRGSLYGAAIGAFLVQAMTQYLGSIGTAYTTFVLGALLISFVLMMPNGLLPTFLRALSSIGIRQR